jgi:hypothetical protein
VLPAEAGDDDAALPLTVLDAQAAVKATRNMEAAATLGLGALERATVAALAYVALLGESIGGNAGAVDVVAAVGVPEEDLRHEQRARDVRPLTLRRALHRAALRRAEAAARARRRLALLGGAERAEPVAVRDGLREWAAVARSVHP